MKVAVVGCHGRRSARASLRSYLFYAMPNEVPVVLIVLGAVLLAFFDWPVLHFFGALILAVGAAALALVMLRRRKP